MIFSISASRYSVFDPYHLSHPDYTWVSHYVAIYFTNMIWVIVKGVNIFAINTCDLYLYLNIGRKVTYVYQCTFFLLHSPVFIIKQVQVKLIHFIGAVNSPQQVFSSNTYYHIFFFDHAGGWLNFSRVLHYLFKYILLCCKLIPCPAEMQCELSSLIHRLLNDPL